MTTYLYAIGRREGPIKIGISNNPAGRLSEFQTACPFQISIIHTEACGSRTAALEDEAFAHRFLRHRRSHGEWFNIGADVAFDVVTWSVLSGREFRDRGAAGED